MFNILVADDDKNTRLLFSAVLKKAGYTVFPAADGKEALEVMDKEHVDLVLLDIMMPNIDGYEFTQILRRSECDLPILMVSAKHMPSDKHKGFLAGTDDYMTKPVDEEELLLRIKALLRRARIASERKIEIGDVILDYDSMTVSRGEEVVELPQKEFQLLYKLLFYPGQIFTRQQILDDIWGPDGYEDSHTLDVHISRLRERFKDNEDFEIVTIRGLGYKAVIKV